MDEVISIAVTQPADIVSKIRSNEHEDVKRIVTAAMDDCMEDQHVKPTITTAMDDHENDGNVKPTITTSAAMNDSENVQPTTMGAYYHG